MSTLKLPEHKCGLYLEHNRHRDYCETVEQSMEFGALEQFDWLNEEAKLRAIETDEVWTLQWYPETPVGFIAVAAPTLDELLAFANGEVKRA